MSRTQERRSGPPHPEQAATRAEIPPLDASLAPVEWSVRLAELVARRQARQDGRRRVREEFAVRRHHGLIARHDARLRR